MEIKQKEMAELAEQQAREAEERAIREAEERENEMELLRQQMARDRDEENRQTEAVRNKELQEQLKVILILILFGSGLVKRGRLCATLKVTKIILTITWDWSSTTIQWQYRKFQ